MSRIVIVVAMDKELATFKSSLNDLKEITLRNRQVYLGTLNNHEIILAKTGIGKVAAGSFLTMLIEKYHPELVINMGIAGGFSKQLKTLDTVVVTKAVYSDVDMTSDEFSDLAYGQLEEMPPYFEIDQKLVELVRSVVGSDAHYGTIATGDQFVTNYEKCKNIVDSYFSDYNVVAFDMESAAFLHVCYLYSIPCLVIRTISDIIGSTTPLDYNNFSTIASNKVGTICKKLIDIM